MAWALLALSVLASACADGSGMTTGDAGPAPIQIGGENVVVVKRDRIVVGPIVSGELRPQREARVRAELAGSMLRVLVEEGQPVERGALLGRIDARTLEDARRAAESAVKSAENQLSVAEREAVRTERLVEAGALAARELDLARSNVTTAEAQLADARARLMAATRDLEDAVVRAPIAGIVSMRGVSVGDVVSVGDELFTIIDPSSMRLEAAVPSESLSSLRVGATVEFTVRGYDERFEGRIERIAPAADPVTRQVPIYVTIPNAGGQLVAGLFADGRVVDQAAEGLIVPLNTVNTNGEDAWALRVMDGRAERVIVELGLRDPRSERVQVTSGLSEGDVLLRGAAQGITPGTPVTVNTGAAG